MKTCCIIVVSIAKLIIMYVLQKYLQTISYVLSSDGHLKPVCVCKLAHNYEHCDHSSLGCRFVLSNVWYESYLRAFDDRVYPLKTTKTGLKYNQLQGVRFRIENGIAKITSYSE